MGVGRRILAVGLLALALSLDTAPVHAQERVAPLTQRQLIIDLMFRATADSLRAKQFANRYQLPVSGELAGATYSLSRIQGGMPVYRVTHNVGVGISVRIEGVREGGWVGMDLEGSGQSIGIWDANTPLTTHVEFGPRVVVLDAESIPASHATHVAGTAGALGIRADARGIAPAVRIDARDWQNDQVEMASAGADGMTVSNHSYGTFGGWVKDLRGTGRWTWMGDTRVSETEDFRYGFYGDEAASWDAISHASPRYLIVKSAGNERADRGPAPGTPHDIFLNGWRISSTPRPPDGGHQGFDSILDSGIGKNVLTIGAVEDLPGHYMGPDDIRMSSFSGWGPTDDGRIKPDLVANGTSVLSPVAGGPEAYAYSSGTSMAAPAVTAVVGLIHEAFGRYQMPTPLSSTVRALLVHTADEAGPSEGPDYQFGWGLVNAARAVSVIQDDAQEGGRIVEGVLQPGQSLAFPLALERSGLEVTLAWTDPPGQPGSPSLNDRTPHLVNNMDLVVHGPLGSYYPWTLDPERPAEPAARGLNQVDTVERVSVQSLDAGAFQAVVSLSSHAQGPQAFSLILGAARRGTTQTGALAGRVYMAGLPVGGVRIHAASAEAISAADGSFILQDLPHGEIEVVPEVGYGFSPASHLVEIPRDTFVEFRATSLVAMESIEVFSSPRLLRPGEAAVSAFVQTAAAGGVYGMKVYVQAPEGVNLAGGRLKVQFEAVSATAGYTGARSASVQSSDPIWTLNALGGNRFFKRVPMFWLAPESAYGPIALPLEVHDAAGRLVGQDTLRLEVDRPDDVQPIIYPRIDFEGRGFAASPREVEIRADIVDGSPLASVRALLRRRDTGEFLTALPLFDDGAWTGHGDAVAGDRLFSALYSSTEPNDLVIDLEATDVVGNTSLETGTWHVSSRPFKRSEAYLLLTWSENDTRTDDHRRALTSVAVPHDYWEFDVRGQLPDSLATAYRGIVWSWGDRAITRPEDLRLLRLLLEARVPLVLAGSRVMEASGLKTLTGIETGPRVLPGPITASPSDTLWAQFQAEQVHPGGLSAVAGGMPVLFAGGVPVASRADSLLVLGFSPASLSMQGDLLRLALFEVTGAPELAGAPTSAGPNPPDYRFKLRPPYPNPAGLTTVLEFTLGTPGHVRMEAFDLLGRRVAVLLDEVRQRGTHNLSWDVSGLTQGVYYVALNGSGGIQGETVVVLGRQP